MKDWLDAFDDSDFDDLELTAIDAAVERITASHTGSSQPTGDSTSKLVAVAIASGLLAAAIVLLVARPLLLPSKPGEQVPTINKVVDDSTQPSPDTPVVRQERTTEALQQLPGLRPHPGTELHINLGVAVLEKGALDYRRDETHTPGVSSVVLEPVGIIATPMGTIFTAGAVAGFGSVAVFEDTVRLHYTDGEEISLIQAGQEWSVFQARSEPERVVAHRTGDLDLGEIKELIPADCVCTPEDVLVTLEQLRAAKAEFSKEKTPEATGPTAPSDKILHPNLISPEDALPDTVEVTPESMEVTPDTVETTESDDPTPDAAEAVPEPTETAPNAVESAPQLGAEGTTEEMVPEEGNIETEAAGAEGEAVLKESSEEPTAEETAQADDRPANLPPRSVIRSFIREIERTQNDSRPSFSAVIQDVSKVTIHRQQPVVHQEYTGTDTVAQRISAASSSCKSQTMSRKCQEKLQDLTDIDDLRIHQQMLKKRLNKIDLSSSSREHTLDQIQWVSQLIQTLKPDPVERRDTRRLLLENRLHFPMVMTYRFVSQQRHVSTVIQTIESQVQVSGAMATDMLHTDGYDSIVVITVPIYVASADESLDIAPKLTRNKHIASP